MANDGDIALKRHARLRSYKGTCKKHIMRSLVTTVSSLFGHLEKLESSEENTDTDVQKNNVSVKQYTTAVANINKLFHRKNAVVDAEIRWCLRKWSNLSFGNDHAMESNSDIAKKMTLQKEKCNVRIR